MDTLEALFFPGTEIYSASQFPVFLLFGKVHLIQPVEDGGDGDDRPDIFASAGLCQAHTPCPLGEERERFLHLIRDIRERKDDYAAQLSSLTVASYSAKKSSVEDSSRSIMSTLLGGTPKLDDDTDTRESELWQARLMLKLGEMVDREEEEVAVQMALLEDDESGLFKDLQGELDEEEETLFGELRELKSKMRRPSATSVAKRLNGWSMLFRAMTEPAAPVFLTATEDAADILLEDYQDRTTLPPVEKLSLPLPANIGWNREAACKWIEEFRESNRVLIDRVTTFLSAPSSSVEDAGSLSKEWEETLEVSFPAAEHGRVSLMFYQMAAVSCTELLGGPQPETPQLLACMRWND